MLTADQENAAYAAILDLKSQLTRARTTVAIGGTWWMLFITSGLSSIDVSGNAKKTAQQALDKDADNIALLEGPLLQQVRNGLKSFASWVEYAKTVQRDIAFQAAETSNWALVDYLSNVATQTAADVKDTAASVGGGFGIGLGAGLLVAAFIAWELR